LEEENCYEVFFFRSKNLKIIYCIIFISKTKINIIFFDKFIITEINIQIKINKEIIFIDFLIKTENLNKL
jgi:hypothetical protein